MTTRSEPLKATVWMIGAMVSFSLMAVSGRELATSLNTFEIMLYRSMIGFLIYGEAFELPILLGAGIIFIAILFNLKAEKQRQSGPAQMVLFNSYVCLRLMNVMCESDLSL